MKTELAQLLALCAAAYNRRDWLALDTEERDRRIQQLDRYGVLSVSALASIFDVSTTKIQAVTPGPRIPVRGTLNPKHISVLAYALSSGTMIPETVKRLTDEGTSINMIHRLTLISKATLHRRLRG